MFVTSEDFNILPYRLASLASGAAEEFQSFIDAEEELFLREVLGDNLYDAFISGLADLPDDWDSTVPTVIGDEYVYGSDVWRAETVTTGVTPVVGSDWTLIETDNRWLLLRNGNTYLMYDKRYRWVGMVKALKALIFSRWVEYNASQNTVNGFVTPKVENNIPVDPGQQICRAWNDWSEKVGGACNPYNSLYGYLYFTNLNEQTFDDTFDETFTSFIDYLAYEFGEQPTKNTFGI